jgi:hypothetical protein
MDICNLNKCFREITTNTYSTTRVWYGFLVKNKTFWEQIIENLKNHKNKG